MRSKTCVVDGISLTAQAGDHITNILEQGLYYERDLLEAVSNMNLSGTYVDVGAFIGTHALWFATKCHSTRVVAIEPNSGALRFLRKNVLDNEQQDKIVVEPVAIHNKYTMCSSSLRNGLNRGSAQIRNRGTIQARRLDDLLADYDDVVLVKIDVEGMETSVLESAKRTIAKHEPVIITEAWNRTMRKQQIKALPDYDVVARYCSTPTLVWLPKGKTLDDLR